MLFKYSVILFCYYLTVLGLDLKNIKEKIWENRQIIFALIVLFFLAASIRSNIIRYEGNYLFEPDAYYHARLVQDIVTQGYIPEIDPDVYYFVEGGMPNSTPELQHYIMAAIYFIISLGIYSKEAVALAVQIAPVLFGSIISVAMYFLAKEIFNDKKIGLFTAFLAAITPAFAYRTMAGAEGNDSLGFVWMVIGFVFLIKAIKSKSLHKTDLINTSLAGIFFGLMAITWRANILIPLILIPASMFMLLYISGTTVKHNSKIVNSEPFNFLVKIAIALGLYTIISYLYGLISTGYASIWFVSLANSIASVAKISPELILIITAVVLIGFVGGCFLLYKSNKETRDLGKTLVIAGLYIGLILLVIFFMVEPDAFYSGTGRQSISSLVGEESLGNQSFGTKYNALIIFPIIGLLFFPISLHFFKKEDSHTQILLWFWAIITLFMAWYKLKFTFFFGLGLVAGAAIAIYVILELIRKYDLKGIEGKTIFIALGFLLILGIGGSDLYLTQFSPFANSSSYWINTMNWIEENTSTDAKFLNWWGDGHQLAFVTERKFSVDNRNASSFGNRAYAEFVITTDVNRGYDIVKNEIGAEYIILPSDNFYSAPTYEFYVSDSVDSRLGQKYYDFETRTISCNKTDTEVNCGGSIIPIEQYNSFGKTWTAVPSDFYNGQTAVYYYAEDTQLVILGPAYNNTNLAKVYFNSTETQKYYEEVYSYNGMKIFKVK